MVSSPRLSPAAQTPGELRSSSGTAGSTLRFLGEKLLGAGQMVNRLDGDSAYAHPVGEAMDKADLRDAYERGRRDERDGRRRRPVLMTFVFIAAAVGAALIAMAAVNGSFGRAGGVVDKNLAAAADRAEPVVRGAAADAGQSLREAGQSAKDKTSAPAG